MVLDVPGLQHAAGLGLGVGVGVGVGVNNHGIRCLANVGAWSFSTWDGAHYTFLRLASTGSLGYTSSCLRVVQGRKVTWIARGAKTLRMDSDSPLM